MLKAKDNHLKKLVQENLFRTIAASLISQFRKSGFDDGALVGFCSEVLDAITDESTKTRRTSDGRLEPYENRSAGECLDVPVAIAPEIHIRPFAQNDHGELKKWMLEERIRNSLAIYSLQLILNRPTKAFAKSKCALFCIARLPRNRPIGLVGLLNIDQSSKQGELVKMIGDPRERGKGYASSATRYVINYGFSCLGLNRIYLHTLDGNSKNINLNCSLGFSFEGVLRRAALIGDQLRDVIIMGMLQEECPSPVEDVSRYVFDSARLLNNGGKPKRIHTA